MIETIVPTQIVGPLKLTGALNGSFSVPLATYETPLWASVQRGAKVTLDAGIQVTVMRERMTRSILCEGKDAMELAKVFGELPNHRGEIEAVAASSSRYLKLLDWHGEIVGNLLFLRLAFDVGGAAGHNMATKGAERIQEWIMNRYSLKYVSISGNYCVDKKNSAINGILGRGKHVTAEITLAKELCLKKLRTTPEQIVELNVKKNLVGSILAGGVRSANAHYANMLLAFYLAMGQDGANIVEGSQGITYTSLRGDDLYFSVNLPNIIVGSVGNGKDLPHVKQNFSILNCFTEDDSSNARALACLSAAVVLCGELSLLAAQTKPKELIRSHVILERKQRFV